MRCAEKRKHIDIGDSPVYMHVGASDACTGEF